MTSTRPAGTNLSLATDKFVVMGHEECHDSKPINSSRSRGISLLELKIDE